jgi:hypothetical protein
LNLAVRQGRVSLTLPADEDVGPIHFFGNSLLLRPTLYHNA